MKAIHEVRCGTLCLELEWNMDIKVSPTHHLSIPYPLVHSASYMGALKKVIIVSSLVLLTALVWQWTQSVDIQGINNVLGSICFVKSNEYNCAIRILQGEAGDPNWCFSWNWKEFGHPASTAWSQVHEI